MKRGADVIDEQFQRRSANNSWHRSIVWRAANDTIDIISIWRRQICLCGLLKTSWWLPPLWVVNLIDECFDITSESSCESTQATPCDGFEDACMAVSEQSSELFHDVFPVDLHRNGTLVFKSCQYSVRTCCYTESNPILNIHKFVQAPVVCFH